MIYLIVIVVVVASWLVSTYNRLVGAREKVHNAKGQIAAQIESRWDALSNLIDATKSYTAHEADTLKEVVNARSRVTEGSSVGEMEADNQAFHSALGRLIAIGEAYPDLKASQVYTQTMASVNTYENNVRHARMIYNDTVTNLNRSVQVFPANLVAGMFGFHKEEYFRETEEKREMPKWN